MSPPFHGIAGLTGGTASFFLSASAFFLLNSTIALLNVFHAARVLSASPGSGGHAAAVALVLEIIRHRRQTAEGLDVLARLGEEFLQVDGRDGEVEVLPLPRP